MTRQWQGQDEEEEEEGLLDVVDGNVTPPISTLYESNNSNDSRTNSEIGGQAFKPEPLGQWSSPMRESESSVQTTSAWTGQGNRDRKALSNPQKPRTYSEGACFCSVQISNLHF